MIAVQAEPFDAAALLADFTARVEGAGAIVTFTGIVRAQNEGADVSALELDHHPRLTERAVAGIAADAARRFDLLDVALTHRFGALAPGEAIVFVAAAAPHRRSAFEAVDYMVDRLKTDALFWKRELRSDGAHWLEAGR
jgi:molybdopterin synthase catalytic subunit